MPLVAFDYRFRVTLPAAAPAAYRWCVDYRPDDWERMGHVGRRKVAQLAPGTILLTDTVRTEKGSVTKKRLVRLRPRDLAWTNTHVAGPTLHSQFLYRILPRGAHRSVLEFTGLQIERAARAPSAAALARRAREVCREDATLWRRHLVRAMAKDLGRRPRRRAK